MKPSFVIHFAHLFVSRLALDCHVLLLRQRGRTIKIGSNSKFFGKPILMLAKNSRLQLGQAGIFRSTLKTNVLGVSHPVIFATVRQGAELVVGDSVGISGGSICAAKSISIGHGTLIGANSTIVDTDFHPLTATERYTNASAGKSAPVVIEENVFIGMGCLILKGVTIGKNSVIGAGSVVRTSIPPNVIAAGNPCVVVKQLN